MSSSTQDPLRVADDATSTDAVLWLHELRAPVGRVGGKAANLGTAARAGFGVLPGFVVPTDVVAELLGRSLTRLFDAWHALTEGGRHRVVVRSSSPVEDGTTSSMAGVFESVVGVRDWSDFCTAFETVLRSAGDQPMAVLVQRHLDPVLSGILFGVDPVTGRADHRVVAAVSGGPWALASGEVAGRRTVLDGAGRVRCADGDPTPVLSRRRLRQLARLAADTTRHFGGPQDVEWAVDDSGSMWLLQSRPVTALPTPAVGVGPRFGPGPVAETFPDPLSPLEADLWLPPLRDAIGHALAITGSVSSRQLRRSPIVCLVERRAVADLDLLEGPARRGPLQWVDPRPPLRRLASAWRMGRLHAAFPTLVEHLVATVDEALADVPPTTELLDEEALNILENVRRYLVAVHAHELLAARAGRERGVTAAEIALIELGDARRQHCSDADIVAHRPIVLSLLPPRVEGGLTLPEVPAGRRRHPDRSLSDREALRLRVRWLHELSARVALELGRRLVDRAVLAAPEEVNGFDVATLADVVSRARTPPPIVEVDRSTPTLPAVFRLSSDGTVVAEYAPTGAAVGAARGRAVGPVSHDDPSDGDVLVVRSLDPRLAAVLPRLAALVSETGSPLSHLAILAREYGIPTVVGLTAACERLAVGQRVLVDGSTGEVSLLDESGPS